MESLGQRIARLRRQNHLSQGALAEKCGWEKGQARIGNYERDLREPNITDLRLLADALGISLMELIEGGERYQAPALSEGDQQAPSKDDYALIPQYSALGAAGNGRFNDHVEIKGGLVFKRAWLNRMALKEQNLHVIYAQGHSMEPTISDGDVVLLDQSQIEPRDGRIYLIRRHGGELIIKRLIQGITGGWIIRSDNDDKRTFPDQPISETDIDQLQIIGRIVWHGGAL
ncbi:S24 family peptidase [Pseudomonas sp. 148P]|uniref:S24 family peptidase n=1 Tax=Pseudomonas ulcerans TaxID=3115852 RepID=A0ABU7HW05_9PSED|nr:MULTISPECIES: S24 family peptidase [unclassified Pseudomonas]MEE1922884.1 S24 family peptidase [Pseudomonas sp. 147P]MEE1935734.1 S24 family peptidase [Pseudomonas sp. 148P]